MIELLVAVLILLLVMVIILLLFMVFGENKPRKKLKNRWYRRDMVFSKNKQYKKERSTNTKLLPLAKIAVHYQDHIEEYPLEFDSRYEFVIGSDKLACQCFINSPYISKQNTLIYMDSDGELRIKDLSSVNGTYKLLKNGDTVRIDDEALNFGDEFYIGSIIRIAFVEYNPFCELTESDRIEIKDDRKNEEIYHARNFTKLADPTAFKKENTSFTH